LDTKFLDREKGRTSRMGEQDGCQLIYETSHLPVAHNTLFLKRF
jgi:hypothetical protein